MTKANILSIQIRPKTGRRERNLEKVGDLIDQNSHLNPDLILMPEFFNTGVSVPEFKKLAETEETSVSLDYFKEKAKKYNTYILTGSIIEKDGEKLYNTSWLLNRNGEIAGKYRKIHLYDRCGGTENQYCSYGDSIKVVETDFGKIGMSVCFDIKFPNHFVNLVKQGAEIIVEPAAWCLPNDTDNWITMNKARALDNMVYFCSSNLCGKIDSYLTSCGHSMIVAPNGQVLSDVGEQEGIAAAQIDIDYLRYLRLQFNLNRL